MLSKMTAEKRANIQWAKCRLMGADIAPNHVQANIFQEMKKNLDAMKDHWKRMEENPNQVMDKFNGAQEAQVV
jgi:hypothetical protein